MYPLGLLSVVVVLGLMALSPLASYSAATSRVEVLEDEQDALTLSVEELQSEADRLQDPAALEEPAREDLGLARPGEVPYIVVNPPTEAPRSTNPSAPATDVDDRSIVDRAVDWFRGLTE